MVVAYWVVTGLPALFFLYAGGVKLVRSLDRLRPMMAWVDPVPPALVRTIGVLEVLAAVGLVLPPLTGIAPGLTLAAVIGLLVIQVGGITVHLRRGEGRVIGLNLALVVALAVAGRLAAGWL